jgi:hypothetical protein
MRIPVVRDRLDAALPVVRHQPGKAARLARAKAARDYHRLVEKKQAASISAEVAQLHHPHLVAHSAVDADPRLLDTDDQRRERDGDVVSHRQHASRSRYSRDGNARKERPPFCRCTEVSDSITILGRACPQKKT